MGDNDEPRRTISINSESSIARKPQGELVKAHGGSGNKRRDTPPPRSWDHVKRTRNVVTIALGQPTATVAPGQTIAPCATRYRSSSSSPVVRHRYPMRTVTVTPAEGNNIIAVVNPQWRRIVPVTPQRIVRNATVTSSSTAALNRPTAASP